VTRYVFGSAAEFRRRANDDVALAAAVRLAAGVTAPRALLDRAAALPRSAPPAPPATGASPVAPPAGYP
jgi:hypothetical protein